MQMTQSGDTEKGLMNALAEVERRGVGKVSQTDLELNTDEQRGKEKHSNPRDQSRPKL